MRFPRPTLTFLLLLVAAWTSGCGYSTGVRLPEGHERIGIEFFGNDSPEPDIERELHQILSDQVARMVSAPVTAPHRADLVIQGQIVDYRRLFGIIGPENELEESGVMITVRGWLYDPRRGVRLGELIRLTRDVRYLVRVRAEEPGARELALRTLSQELVLDLLSQEDYEPADTEPVAEEPERPEERGLVTE